MKESLNRILEKVLKRQITTSSEFVDLIKEFFRVHVKASHIEKYIGDFPTFIEPVYLQKNITIGDDVLLGPNTYLGENVEIGDFTELSNVIVFDNAHIGDNMKFENCVITENSQLNFNHFSAKNSVIQGVAEKREDLEITRF